MGSPSQGLTRPGHFGTMPDNPEIWKAVAMADHFEKIQKLPDPIPGVPNFRRVPGYKVYCCGQPTAAALETTLNKVCGEIYPKTFVAWMEEHAKLRTIVEEGKGKLQWERDIPASALSNLESLASSDFKANLGKIIHDIYQTAHTMFSDMPQGDHKKRAKYSFASKTLMRILPVSLKSEVEGLIEKKAITLDLYEILGQCTWGQKAAEKA